MRISDWSSDVCSSDLKDGDHGSRLEIDRDRAVHHTKSCREYSRRCSGHHTISPGHARPHRDQGEHVEVARPDRGPTTFEKWPARPDHDRGCQRSEEHTSELQSLMRISYAVFCLKKNTK